MTTTQVSQSTLISALLGDNPAALTEDVSLATPRTLASLMPMSPSAEQRGFGDPLIAASSPIAAGAAAPAFALAGASDRKIALSDFVGQSVILVFYPADWSPVCTDQLALYNELLPLFEEHRAQVLGISVDGVWSHRAFAKDRNLRFPLLSDFEPKGAVARAYGVYSTQDGTSERALFVIDGAGIVRWSFVSPSGVNPGADGILQALEDLARSGVAS